VLVYDRDVSGAYFYALSRRSVHFMTVYNDLRRFGPRMIFLFDSFDPLHVVFLNRAVCHTLLKGLNWLMNNNSSLNLRRGLVS